MYKPLNPDAQETRLLTLHRGSEPEWIHCTLSVESLEDRPSYTAVSYAWGTNQPVREIVINGVAVDVTHTVYEMLMTLRDMFRNRCLWVDALCINQDDAKEKAHQVGMMGSIYSNATCTYIWLGPSSEASDLAMDFVVSAGPDDFERSQMVSKPNHWKALHALLRRAWWSRLWIVQEACLSKRAIIRCGDKEVELDTFRRFYQLHKQSQRFALPLHARLVFADVPFAYVLGAWDMAMSNVVKGQSSLSAWMAFTTYAQNSLPRDRLFALLSLSSSEDRKAIKIDYRRPDRDIFKEAATHFIRKNGLICLQAGRVPKSANFNLPSWVPDWTYLGPPRGIHFIAPSPFSYAADGDAAYWQRLKIPPWNLPGEISSMDQPARFSPDCEVLAVRGLIFDEICYADLSFMASCDHGQLAAAIKAVQPKDLTPDMVHAMRSWEARVMAFDKDAYSKTCGRNEAFWRTLIADRTGSLQATPADFATRFETLMGRQNGSLTESEKWVFREPFSSRAFACCFRRAFVITRKGYLGLAPSSTQIGDFVCVLKGGNAPVILHPKDGSFYRYLGDSYVHGIMNGECVREAKPEDVQEFWVR